MIIESYTPYDLKTYHDTKLELKDGILTHNINPKKNITFIPVVDNYAVIIPDINIKMIEKNFVGELFKLKTDDDYTYLKVVKYKINENNTISLYNLFNNQFISAKYKKNENYFDYENHIKEWEMYDIKQKNIYYHDFYKFSLFLKRINSSLKKCIAEIDHNIENILTIDIFFQLLDINTLTEILKKSINLKNLLNYKKTLCNDYLTKYCLKKYKKNQISCIDEKYDFLGEIYNNKFYKNITQRVIHLYKQTIIPEKEVCVVATARNEGIYLLEFIAHYRSLGINDIFIYSNDNDDESDNLLEALAKNKYIYYIKNKLNEGTNAQGKAYIHALLMNSQIWNFEYSLFVDIDEFLYINNNRFDSISEFINFHKKLGSNSIGINWILPSLKNKINYEDSLLSERYDKYIYPAGPHIKSLFNTSTFASIHCHYPMLPFTNANYNHASGICMSKSTFKPKFHENAFFQDADINNSYIVHHIYKSLDELIYKFARNGGDHAFKKNNYFSRLNKSFISQLNNIFDPKITIEIDNKNILSKIKLEINNMLKNEDIASAEKKCKLKFDNIHKNYKKLFLNFLSKNDLMYNEFKSFLNKNNITGWM